MIVDRFGKDVSFLKPVSFILHWALFCVSPNSSHLALVSVHDDKSDKSERVLIQAPIGITIISCKTKWPCVPVFDVGMVISGTNVCKATVPRVTCVLACF